MKYDLIYADCPWKYDNMKNNNPAMGGITYPVLSQKDLFDLPIKDIVKPNSVCLMWATMPKLIECLDVMRNWGFKYITCAFTWVKINPRGEVKRDIENPKDLIIGGGI